MADTLYTNIVNTSQEYIARKAIMPVAYNVPQNEMMTVERLPQKGIILRVPRVRELALATDVWATEIHLASSTTGAQAMNFDYDEYTMEKLGTYVRVGDKASFSSLLEMVDNVGRVLSNSMARTMNNSVYDALAHQRGFQWMRVDGDNTAANGEVQGRIAAGVPTETTTPSNSAEVDSFWGLAATFYGQITFTSGANAGLSRRITDFANATGLVTHDAFPQAAVSGDTFDLCNLGDDGVIVGPGNLAASDTMTLKQLYRALERCRRRGAGSIRFAGPTLTMTGIRRDNSADVANGVAFMPTSVAHDVKATLYDAGVANNNDYFQTSEGFRRAVGGQISRIGGCLVVETNHFKRASIAGVLASGTGVGFPVMVMFQDGGGATVLRDQPSRRQGLVSVMKKPSNNDMAILYGSVKAQGEMWVINKYFCRNSLWGAIMWCGTTTE